MHATGNGRSRAHGRQYDAALDARRSHHGGIRSERRRREEYRRRRRGCVLFARRPGQQAEPAARRLDHGALGRSHGKNGAGSRRAHAGGRHHHRRRQLLFQRRRSPLEDLRRQRRALRRRRHQRRRLGTRARLLHDDWRPERGRPAPRPDLQDAGAGTRRHPAHSGTREDGGSAALLPKTATSTAARPVPDIS